MKSRPILFSGPMVRAILDGTKTQTRRVMKPQPVYEPRCFSMAANCWFVGDSDQVSCPYGVPGDRLWVRETHHLLSDFPDQSPEYLYRATDTNDPTLFKWTPSIFMPLAACRLHLEITEVRVERLRDISEEDAEAEGVEEHLGSPQMECDDQVRHYPDASFVKSYRTLWDGLNDRRGFGWATNPWVWAITFKRITPTPGESG